MSTEVRVPTLGESVTEATVATWFKKPGDAVAADEMLCELETDKVTVEVPSPAAGTLGEIVAPEGETVGVDALLATLITRAQGAAPARKRAAALPPKARPKPGRCRAAKRWTSWCRRLGESVTEATVASWFKAVGDTVAADEMLCELETDKVSVEVPAPAAGVLTEILAAEGRHGRGRRQAWHVITGGVLPPPQPAPASPACRGASTGGKPGSRTPRALGQKMMAEKGPDARPGHRHRPRRPDHEGRCAEGRCRHRGPRPPHLPRRGAPPRARSPPRMPAREERVKMTRLRQTIARRLKDAQNTAAMLTTYNEVDMGAVMDLRSKNTRTCSRRSTACGWASCPSSPRPACTP